MVLLYHGLVLHVLLLNFEAPFSESGGSAQYDATRDDIRFPPTRRHAHLATPLAGWRSPYTPLRPLKSRTQATPTTCSVIHFPARSQGADVAARRWQRARLCYKAAELLRTEAERPRDLHAARALYRLAMCGGNSELRQDARERLLLMLFQSGKTPSSSSAARRLLAAGGFVGLLTPRVLNSREVMLLPRFFPSREDAPIMKQFDAVDNALPAGMLLALQRAFGPSSPFWTEHKYKCGGAKASPFFSYVHSLSGPPKKRL